MSIVGKLSFGLSKSMPIVLQTEATECGLACLAMVLGHHGYESDLPTLRRRFSISLKGTTLKHLIDIAGQCRLSARPMRLELADLGKLTLPCILHWDFNHFVVLKEVRRDGIVICDPAIGLRRLPLDLISKHFTGVALELTPNAGFKPIQDRQSFSWRQLIGATHGLNRSLVQIFSLALALEAILVLAPILQQWLFDHVLVTADTNLLTLLGLGLLFLELTRVAINLVRGWAVMIMSASLNIQWIANVFSHLVRLPIAWFEKRHIGDVISRFNSIHTIQRTLTTQAIESLLDGLMCVAALVMMFTYNLELTFVVLGAVAAYWLLRLACHASLREITESQIVFEAKQQSFFLESLRALRAIRLFNAADERKSHWLNHLVDEKNAGLRAQRLGVLMDTGKQALFAAQKVAVLWMGARAVLDNHWSVGMLLAFIAYKDQFAQRATGLVDKALELRMLRLQGERLADIVLGEPETHHLASVDASELPASLEVSNLSFRYADREPWVLRNLSLTVKPGERVAIIGPSGCGKTTLLKLLSGLAEPTQGEVLYGAVRLNQVGTVAYRDLIGFVMQDDRLISGSIADNIAFFSIAPDQARIEVCARMAAIHDEIRAMPMGYHTLVGDMGTTLSGGQKQRILLARALYKQPKLLFLDEATSHLDVVNEALVNNAVRQLGLTTVIIAHRPETIRMADRVIVIENGHAVELDKEKIFVERQSPVRSNNKVLGFKDPETEPQARKDSVSCAS